MLSSAAPSKEKPNKHKEKIFFIYLSLYWELYLVLSWSLKSALECSEHANAKPKQNKNKTNFFIISPFFLWLKLD